MCAYVHAYSSVRFVIVFCFVFFFVFPPEKCQFMRCLFKLLYSSCLAIKSKQILCTNLYFLLAHSICKAHTHTLGALPTTHPPPSSCSIEAGKTTREIRGKTTNCFLVKIRKFFILLCNTKYL